MQNQIDLPQTTVSREQISQDLAQLGLRQGDTVLVHSSLKSIGHVAGGPDAVLDALEDVLGCDGLLVFPSFQKGGEHKLLREGVIFDLRTSPTGQGLIPETFRHRRGTIRSLSPTHSLAACGKDAESFLAGHELCNVSAGRHTPFEKLLARKGKILLLGVTHSCNTTLHYVENVHGAPTVSREEFLPVVVDMAGVSHTVPTYPHMPGLRRRYERVEQELLDEGIQNNGRIGKALSRLIDAKAMDAHLSLKLQKDPLYLIEVFCPS